ncbi:MAG TPA: glycosyltransferase [Proteobacteria bacterium]|nr:glycosyltransferase [Pseudomonadota bacterium]
MQDNFFFVTVVIYYGLLILLAIFCLHRFYLVFLYWRRRRPDPPLPVMAPDDWPTVTVQLPLYNEKYVARRLLEHAAALDYPADRLQIQVLDDSSDETADLVADIVAELSAQGCNIVHLHRRERQGFKAGALAAGLADAGELVAVFDADFLPAPDFLKRSVPYFQDAKLGMVQARWEFINRDYSWLTRVQAMLLDGHFVIEHTARNRSGRFFNFNGTAGIWRSRTITEAGGWRADTLTEDLDLSYRAQLRGWRFLYLKDLTVGSELPEDINAFKTQQHRWAKGSAETLLKLARPLLSSRLPPVVKGEAFFHLAGNFAYLLLLALSLVMYPSLIGRFQLPWQRLLLIDAPLFLATSCSISLFFLVAQREIRHFNRRTLITLPLCLAIGVGLAINNGKAVLEALLHQRSPFVRTPKFNLAESGGRRPSYRSHLLLVPLLEILVGLYFVLIMTISVHLGKFALLPFLGLFACGFAGNGISSLIHNRRRFWAWRTT